MTEQLETALHSEVLAHNAFLAQTVNTSGLPLNYESGNEDEKPILLELGNSSDKPKTSALISSAGYPDHYPLDLQLNSAIDLVLPTAALNYNIDPDILFNNPYMNRMPTAQSSPKTSSHSSASSTMITLKSVPYPAHIPQTVYTWSTPNSTATARPSERNSKITTETVPPPVYITYSDVRSNTITKQTNHSWKEKALQNEKDYKKTACDRERTRMRDMNRAFDQLRSKLPISKPNGKKYSKIESLRIAINYINHLQRLLQENMTDPNFITNEEFAVKRRSTAYRFGNHITNSFPDAKEKFESLDETRSTWSDGYIPNSQDKWD